jgi:hypothetical protein
MTATRPSHHQTAIITARRQHIGAAEKSLIRIRNLADIGLTHLKDGHPAGPVARQIIAEAGDLLVQLAKTGLLDEFAAWLRREAA